MQIKCHAGIKDGFSSLGAMEMGPVHIKYVVLMMLVLLLITGHGYAELDNKALFEKGIDAFKAGRHQEAVDFFSALISVAPDDAKAYKNRGVALMNLGEMDPAIADFNEAIRINPELKGLHSNLGAAWHYKGAYDKAIACYDIDIAQRPDLYITYFNRALSKAEAGQLEKALVDMEKTLQLKPDFELAVSAKNEIQEKLEKLTPDKYVVQTGAFLVGKNAIDMKDALTEKGYDAKIVMLPDSKQRSWHLVRIERDLDHETAEKICRKLKEQENIMAVIRPAGKF
jgi:tetratricopeptide (TPR) repeat protein